jgi:hypothetical protein
VDARRHTGADSRAARQCGHHRSRNHRSGGRSVGGALLETSAPLAVARRSHATTVEVRQFYYPNWIGTVNGSASVSLTPAPSTGLLRMDLPAGKIAVESPLHTE